MERQAPRSRASLLKTLQAGNSQLQTFVSIRVHSWLKKNKKSEKDEKVLTRLWRFRYKWHFTDTNYTNCHESNDN